MTQPTITQEPVNIGPMPRSISVIDDSGATIIMLTVALVIVHFLNHINRNNSD